MSMPLEAQLQGELTVSKLANCELCKQLVEEQEKNKWLNRKVEVLSDITGELARSINRSLIKENDNITRKLRNINKVLNDLYEAIDEQYTETLENNDKLAIVRAEAELKLIKKIIDEVEGC